MRLPGLKHRLQPKQLYCVDNLPRQRVFDSVLGAHAAPFGARLAGVEVERVEALVVLVFRWGRGVEGWGLRLLGLGWAECGGSGDVGGADEGVGEVVWVLLWGVGVRVRELFYSGVLRHGRMGEKCCGGDRCCVGFWLGEIST